MKRRTRSALAVTAAGAVLAAAAPPSYADPPDRFYEEQAFEQTYQAGEFCSVAVHEQVEGLFRGADFGDGRSVFKARTVFTYTNLATGAVVTDTGRFTVWERGDRLIITGLGIKFRGPDGKTFGIQAGRTVVDAETFEVISHTGRDDVGDYAAAVCAALGAAPAV